MGGTTQQYNFLNSCSEDNPVNLNDTFRKRMTDPEEKLIRRLQNKDEEAFRELVEEFNQKVFNTCMGFVRNEEDADDLAQEVFIEVYQSIKKFKGQSSLSTWIYRITVNKSLEFLRKMKSKKRSGFFSKIFGNDDSASLEVPDYDHPGIKAENREQAGILYAAIEKLPDNQRTAFTLHKLEGLSYEQIAEIIQKSVSSVESLMFRAKTNLKKELYEYYKNM